MLKKRIKLLMAASIVFATQNAHAALTPYNLNGIDLVYSSVSDVTWTKDANLLGTMFVSQGFNTVVNAVIAANTTSGYSLSADDFSNNGMTTWFGAIAYVNYLNSIEYAGSSQWTLPTFSSQIEGFNTPSNGTTIGNELSELFYQELGGIQGSNIPNTASFENEQFWAYWSATEYLSDPNYAWTFATYDGYQYRGEIKDIFPFYVWAVSTEQIAAIPEPESIAMLLAGLGLIGIAIRRNREI